MMTTFDQEVDDYSTTPVPQSKTVGGIRISLIVIGIGIALPGFLEGAQIGTAMGIQKAAIAFVIGGIVLAFLGSLTSLVAVRARLTTYMLVQYSFGETGARFVNFILAATMFGWFGVNAALFGNAVFETLRLMYGWTHGDTLYIIIGSLLMILTTVFGFKALDRLSMLCVPLLLFILVYILWLSFARSSPAILFAERPAELSMGWAISAVIGGNMVMVATMPDLARYVSSGRQAIFAMIVSFALASPIILLSAAVPSLATGESNLIKIIMSLGFGMSALYVVIFSTWTSNAANLYCSGLSFAATFPKIVRWKLTVFAGILGMLVALSGVVDMFIPFLMLLGIAVPPVAVIFVIDSYTLFRNGYDPAFFRRNSVRWSAFASWIVAMTVAFMTARNVFHMTTVPAFDAILVSIVAYLALSTIFRQEISEGVSLRKSEP